ncbi:MAG: MarR family transcriptional regulator [Peptococcaceae bacterium]|nr:MarR family transcriptional regulator [Peptococcaceae bacterium]
MANEDVAKILEEYALPLHAMIVFRRAERTIRSQEDTAIKAHGLTPGQFGVLDVLYSKGPMRVCALVERMLATPGNMTVIIRNMERDGYITRSPDPDDKRASRIALTDKGRAIIEETLPDHARHVAQIFQVLSKEDQRALIRILRQFKNLKDI